MEMDRWVELLGLGLDDPKLKAALNAAGVKKPPKIGRADYNAFVELKGLSLEFVLKGKAIVLIGVNAVIESAKNRNLYKGVLPYELRADMTRAELRKKFGKRHDSDDEVPFDSWLRDGREVIVGYTASLRLAHLKIEIPLNDLRA